MLKKDFDEFLDSLGLSRKDFGCLANIPYTTINNWNDTNRTIPNWVHSWLENYKNSQKFKKIKEMIKDDMD